MVVLVRVSLLCGHLSPILGSFVSLGAWVARVRVPTPLHCSSKLAAVFLSCHSHCPYIVPLPLACSSDLVGDP